MFTNLMPFLVSVSLSGFLSQICSWKCLYLIWWGYWLNVFYVQQRVNTSHRSYPYFKISWAVDFPSLVWPSMTCVPWGWGPLTVIVAGWLSSKYCMYTCVWTKTVTMFSQILKQNSLHFQEACFVQFLSFGLYFCQIQSGKCSYSIWTYLMKLVIGWVVFNAYSLPYIKQ